MRSYPLDYETRVGNFIQNAHGKIVHHAIARKRAAAVCTTPHVLQLARDHGPEMKDPSGGTTGRVKPYGRLGWMGARAEYSRWGGITAPTSISRSTLAGRSKRRAIFFNLVFGTIIAKPLCSRLFCGV
jgi:hypothetical protein